MTTEPTPVNSSGEALATPSEPGAASERAPHTPVLRVVKGDLAPEELAALVAVVAARNAAAANAAARASTQKPRSEWGHPARAHQTVHRIGPGQWRRSAW